MQGKQMQLPQLRIMDARASAKVLRMTKPFAIRKLRFGGEMTSFARLENIGRRSADFPERESLSPDNDCLGQQIAV
jgi:hypothetical protein